MPDPAPMTAADRAAIEARLAKAKSSSSTTEEMIDFANHIHTDMRALLDENKRLESRVKQLSLELSVSESMRGDYVEAIAAMKEFDGDEDCWAALKEQRDKAEAENKRLAGEVVELKRGK